MLDFKLLDKVRLSEMTAEETVNYLVKNSIPITHKKIGNSLHIKSMQNGF